jgi:hypothetical protein
MRRVFLDATCWVAAAGRPEGGSAKILLLAREGRLVIVTTQFVHQERGRSIIVTPPAPNYTFHGPEPTNFTASSFKGWCIRPADLEVFLLPSAAWEARLDESLPSIGTTGVRHSGDQVISPLQWCLARYTPSVALVTALPSPVLYHPGGRPCCLAPS